MKALCQDVNLPPLQQQIDTSPATSHTVGEIGLSAAQFSVLEGLNVVWLVSTCRCNDGKFMSVRKAFGLVLYPLVFLSRYFV